MKNLINLLFKRGGRISRRQYFFSLFGAGVIVILAISGLSLIISENTAFSIILFSILWLLLAYVTTNLHIKRFHDLGNPGTHFFYFLVPFYNIYVMFKLLVEKGENKDNKYGNKIIHKKKIPVIARIGIIIVGIGISVGLLIFSILGIIKNSGAYEVAKQTILKNEELQKTFGSEIEFGFMPMGQISVSGPNGKASLQINIEGTEKGKVYVNLTKKLGKWNVIEMVVEQNGEQEKIIQKK